jgi:hypothetical protein
MGGVQGKLHYMAPEQARWLRRSAPRRCVCAGGDAGRVLGGGALSPVSSDESGDAREAAAVQRGLSCAGCAR